MISYGSCMNALLPAGPVMQKRLGQQFFGVTGIGGASRPLPERKQERPRLSATRLRRQRPKWPWPRRRSGSLLRRRTQNRPTRGKLPASRFPTDRPSACPALRLDYWLQTSTLEGAGPCEDVAARAQWRTPLFAWSSEVAATRPSFETAA